MMSNIIMSKPKVQNVCHDMAKYVMMSNDVITLKLLNIKKYVVMLKMYVKYIMMSKSTLWHEKVRYDVTKYVIASRGTSYTLAVTSHALDRNTKWRTLAWFVHYNIYRWRRIVHLIHVRMAVIKAYFLVDKSSILHSIKIIL